MEIKDKAKRILVHYAKELEFRFHSVHFRLEYFVGNFLDPPAKMLEKKESIDEWCERITVKQAYRYAKYHFWKWSITALRAEHGDLSEYNKKDRVLLEKLKNSILQVRDAHEDLFKKTQKRLFEEKYLRHEQN